MKKVLKAPLTRSDLEGIHVGDIVYYTGTLVTGRDDVHRKVVVEKEPCPVDMEGIALFHAGPIVDESGGGMKIVSVGPTSSIRMENEAGDFMKMTGLRLMIGKGGMGPKTTAACQEHGAIHCVYPGGCAVSASRHVSRISDVFWRELGMPECMWVFEVEEFGPLVVSIDMYGGNLFESNRAVYQNSRAVVGKQLREQVSGYILGDEEQTES